MELYVNGNRAGADIYDNSYYFRQDTPAGITVDSASADVELKNIRIYNRALSDDEVLDNRMVDAGSSDDMMRLYEENDILGGSGDVDIDKLRSKGKGVMRIVRKGGLDEVNETNNKKTDFIADVYFCPLSARSTTSSSATATSASGYQFHEIPEQEHPHLLHQGRREPKFRDQRYPGPPWWQQVYDASREHPDGPVLHEVRLFRLVHVPEHGRGEAVQRHDARTGPSDPSAALPAGTGGR